MPRGVFCFSLDLFFACWIAARDNFLFPVKSLSRVFLGKFLDLLGRARRRGEIDSIYNNINVPHHKDWVGYAKKPFGSPPTVLDASLAATPTGWRSPTTVFSKSKTEKLLSSYRDRKDGDRKKIMTLEAQEFIRRFLLHVLPDGFMRIRHFGFLANRSKEAGPRCVVLGNFYLNPALPKSPILSAKDLLLILIRFQDEPNYGRVEAWEDHGGSTGEQ